MAERGLDPYFIAEVEVGEEPGNPLFAFPLQKAKSYLPKLQEVAMIFDLLSGHVPADSVILSSSLMLQAGISEHYLLDTKFNKIWQVSDQGYRLWFAESLLDEEAFRSRIPLNKKALPYEESRAILQKAKQKLFSVNRILLRDQDLVILGDYLQVMQGKKGENKAVYSFPMLGIIHLDTRQQTWYSFSEKDLSSKESVDSHGGFELVGDLLCAQIDVDKDKLSKKGNPFLAYFQQQGGEFQFVRYAPFSLPDFFMRNDLVYSLNIASVDQGLLAFHYAEELYDLDRGIVVPLGSKQPERLVLSTSGVNLNYTLVDIRKDESQMWIALQPFHRVESVMEIYQMPLPLEPGVEKQLVLRVDHGDWRPACAAFTPGCKSLLMISADGSQKEVPLKE